MKNIFRVVLFVLFSNLYNSQIAYEKGYFVNNNGKKIECLIKNEDWKNSPKNFKYKLSEKGEIITMPIENIKKFEVLGSSKYEKFKINIDDSSVTLPHLPYSSKPVYKEKTVLLKELVDGDVKLYSYVQGNLFLYFYKTSDNDVPKQLIYKLYFVNDESGIAINNQYKNQLVEIFGSKIEKSKIEKANYNETNLISIFSNSSENQSKVATSRNKLKYNLNIRPGILFANKKDDFFGGIFNKTSYKNLNGFRIGFEGELIFNFNKNKWSLIFEPTYINFKSTENISYNISELFENTNQVKTSAKYFEIPVGFRFYSFINQKSKLFFNTQYKMNYYLSSKIEKSSNTLPATFYNPIDGDYFIVGLGYNYKNRFTVEVRTSLKRDTYFSAILGYNIF